MLTAKKLPCDFFNKEYSNEDLKRRAIRGGAVTIFSQVVKFFLQTGSTMVLARLLTPEDFGLIAMAGTFLALSGLLQDFGLSMATIQRSEISHEQINAMFWVNTSIGCVLMFITAAMGPVLSWFYNESRLTEIMLVIGTTFFLSGLNVQHTALLKRQMRYETLALRDVTSMAIAVGLTISFALMGFDYWALVVMSVSANVTEMTISWVAMKWRPGAPGWAKGMRSMLLFGGNLTGFNLINYFSRNADNILIGWFWGAGPLGLYSKAYALLMLPLQQINAPLTSVSIPAFSRIADDAVTYANSYFQTINLIMWIASPIVGFMFVAAEPLILIVLGDQWKESANVFRWLAISGLCQPIYNTTGWIFISQGRTDRMLKIGIITAPLIVASFVVGLPYNITAIAASYSIMMVALFPFVMKFTFKGTSLTLEALARSIMCPGVVCVATVVCAFVVDQVIQSEHKWMRVSVTVCIFLLSYFSFFLVPCVRREFVALKNIIRNFRSLKAA